MDYFWVHSRFVRLRMYVVLHGSKSLDIPPEIRILSSLRRTLPNLESGRGSLKYIIDHASEIQSYFSIVSRTE